MLILQGDFSWSVFYLYVWIIAILLPSVSRQRIIAIDATLRIYVHDFYFVTNPNTYPAEFNKIYIFCFPQLWLLNLQHQVKVGLCLSLQQMTEGQKAE